MTVAAYSALISSALFGLGLLMLSASRRRIGWGSLIAIYSYAHLALFVLRPIYIAVYGEGREVFSNSLVGDGFVRAAWISGAGYIAVVLGYIAAGRGIKDSQSADSRALKQQFDTGEYQRLRPVLLCVVLVGMVLYAQYIRVVGIERYLELFRGGRSVELTESLSTVSGYYSTGLQFAIGALVLLVLLSSMAGERVSTVFYVGLLLLAVAPQVASGSRSVFVPVVVALLVVAARLKPSAFRLSRVLVVGPFAFVALLIAPRTFRTSQSDGRSIAEATLSAFSPKEAFTNFVGGFDTAMIDAFARQIDATSRGFVDLKYGESYLYALSAPIPRGVWDSKPGTIDQYLNDEIFPVTASEGIGFSFGIYSEPYANFGLCGTVILFLLGLGLARAETLRFASSPVALWIFAMLAGYIFPFVRGSLSFDSQRLLVSFVPAIAAILWVRITQARQPSRRTEVYSRSSRADWPTG